MKKFYLLFLSVIICTIFVSPAFAAAQDNAHPARVVDEASLLSRSEYQDLLSELDRISQQNNFDVVVVTVTSLGGKSAMDFADDYFDYNGYGMGDDFDGILLLIAIRQREYYMTTHGAGIRTFTDAGLEYIEDQIVPYLSDGDYYEAFSTFADLCNNFIKQADNGTPYDYGHLPRGPFRWGTYLISALIVGIILAAITTSFMKGKLKSVQPKNTAADYTLKDSFNITNSRDLFLYRSVTRTPIPRDNPPSSGSRGSSAHKSSSGSSHGGRGGRF